MSRLGTLVEHLYQYHFRHWQRQAVVYALTFTITLLYAIINGLMLGRPERSVALESAVLTAVLLIGLPIAYIIVVINPQSSTAEALVKAGMVTEALAAAREIEAADKRALALRSIFEALVKAEMWAEALAVAHEIEAAGNRELALYSIFEALVKAEMWAEALAIARKIGVASDTLPNQITDVRWLAAVLNKHENKKTA